MVAKVRSRDPQNEVECYSSSALSVRPPQEEEQSMMPLDPKWFEEKSEERKRKREQYWRKRRAMVRGMDAPAGERGVLQPPHL